MSNFEIDVSDCEFLYGEDPPASVIQHAQRRARDTLLLRRAATVSKELQPMVAALFADYAKRNPTLCEGLAAPSATYVRPAPTPGQAAVLTRLIEVVLRPVSATMTQDDCRCVVAGQFPSHHVTKNWTRLLPSFAIERAKAVVAGSAAPISTIKVKSGATLKDLHEAVRSAVNPGVLEGKVSIAIHDDAVVLNGERFKRSVTTSNGHSYDFARLPIDRLMTVLSKQAKA
jgi:hypothetical protein